MQRFSLEGLERYRGSILRILKPAFRHKMTRYLDHLCPRLLLQNSFAISFGVVSFFVRMGGLHPPELHVDLALYKLRGEWLCDGGIALETKGDFDG
jgi:hypothetical protein